LGYTFNDQEFAEKMKAHQNISRAGATKKFAGGLADHSEKTIMGHTATHLLHQALRDVLGNHVHQTGSNITSERIRFDFNYEKSLTEKQIKRVEEIVNEKIRANLPVHFEMLSLKKAKEIGAIGLFDDKYADTVKIYFIGPTTASGRPYSVEFCGGPHVDFTSKVKRFKITKQENIGSGKRRIYAKAG
jgi:alanyl-tRNA synthetase